MVIATNLLSVFMCFFLLYGNKKKYRPMDVFPQTGTLYSKTKLLQMV